MSSNDQIVIIETDKGFDLYHNHCVDNPVTIKWLEKHGDFIREAKTLREAIKRATRYCNENMVEYGYTVLFRVRKE